jgi:DNA-binding SARP family transcriptional activator/tetratricopeptide (TPR) repeat protein
VPTDTLSPPHIARCPSAAARFLLLGPVEARHPHRRLPLGRRRERALLAVLLLEANRVVPAGRLVDLLWDGSPPSSARASLHTHMSRLRGSLDPDGAGRNGVRLYARAGGYLAEADPETVDAHCFTNLVERARGTADAAARAAVVRNALALWRGPVLADAGSDLLRQRVAADLEELRLVAYELAVDADLERGRHDEVVGEVTRLIGDHPLREGLWARLALALYRAGRQGEALAALARARDRIVEELGVEPGPALQQVQLRILTADPALATATAGVPEAEAMHVSTVVIAPRQLPMDIREFTGRRQELAQLAAAAGVAAAADAPTAPTICVIEGMAGVGKTRLAVHAAHRMASGFDGPHLWADLRGFDAERSPADPATILDVFLRLLGVPAQQVPDDLDARAALYRSRLAGSRALVLLDNVATEDQVRPLLPGGGGALVLITTRRHLSGLPGVRHVPLDVFAPDEAVSLLAHLGGAARVSRQPQEAARVAELCGYLPIAITLTGQRLRAHPSWTVRDLADRLVPEERRLGELSLREQEVQRAFDLSYRTLPPRQRRFFRLLGLYPGADVNAEGAAALTGHSRAEADRLLEALLEEHLLQESSPGRYRMHDLTRGFARERARREEPQRLREDAIAGLVRRFLAEATQATVLLHPADTRRLAPLEPPSGSTLRTRADAIAWVDANLADLVAVVQHAADLSDRVARLAVRLVAALYRPLANRGQWRVRVTLHQRAAEAAARVGDQQGEAQSLEDLGTVYGQIGRPAESIAYNERALVIWRKIGDQRGEAGCLVGLGITYRQMGRFDEAVECLREGLAVSEIAGYGLAEASVLNQLGLTYQGMGRLPAAFVHHGRSIAKCQEIGDRRGEALALANLAWAHQRSGRPDQAFGPHRESLAIFRDLGDRYNEAEQLWGLGRCHHAIGEHARARSHWRQSIALLRDIGLLETAQAAALLRQPVPETPEIIGLNT